MRYAIFGPLYIITKKILFGKVFLMKFTAIVSEYNPFHNGHKFQINLIKGDKASHCVVAIMSGNFTQRGEPAVFDKWFRTRLALLGGVDVVIELPVLYALQSAEGFASGGVKIANELSVIDELCFGSESADEQQLRKSAHALLAEEAGFKAALKESLGNGLSFPSARMEALKSSSLPGPSGILQNPNDILGIEYLKALIRFKSNIRPKIIRRAGSSYSNPTMTGPLSSALAIRNSLKEGSFSSALLSIPVPLHGSCKDFLKISRPVFPEYFFDLLAYRLRLMSPDELSAIAGVNEGLHNKIKQAAAQAADYPSLMAGVKSKRYTQTRISRIFMSCLLDITKAMQDEANTYKGLYARVLGYRKEALGAFSQLCQKSRIPVVTSGTQLPKNILSNADIQASDIYSLACADRSAGKDFTKKLIII
jgi:predicted nucleotidyltransferase